MDHIVSVIFGYWHLHKEAILAVAAPGGALVSVAIQWFLHHFKIDGPRLSFLISHIFALATAASTWWLDSAHPNVGFSWVWLWVAAQFWHQFAVNPAYKKYVLPLLAMLAGQKVANNMATGAIQAAASDSALE